MKKDNNVYKLDQFFTKKDIAVECIKELEKEFKLNEFDLVIEPSAGEGSFFYNLNTEKKIGIEIDSEICLRHKDYVKSSFLRMNFSQDDGYILVIGNPPFGNQNKLSVNFFNHASKFADVIAFIVPKTWKKTSIQNRLDENFHLIKTIDLIDDCFYGVKITTVKCCFQIWKRQIKKRDKIVKTTSHKDWDFLPFIKKDKKIYPPKSADFVILAYGSNSGQISKDLNRWRPKSVHFIKSKIDINKLVSRFSALDYSCANDSARQSSLGKADLIELYINKFGE